MVSEIFYQEETGTPAVPYENLITVVEEMFRRQKTAAQHDISGNYL
jgi:hypothetical protein